MLLIALLTTATLVGGWLLRSRGLTAGLEGLLFRVLLGVLVTATLLLPLAMTSLAAASGVLIAVALAGMTREVFHRRAAPPLPTLRSAAPLDRIEWAIAAALAAMAASAAVRAMTPPVAPEALIIHLALAKDAVLENGLRAHARHPLSAGVDLGQSIRALLYLWKSTLTVTAWQALTAVLAVAALYALVRRMASRRAAMMAAAGFAAVPATVALPGLAGNDMLAAAFVLASLVALQRWRQEGQSACGVLAGVLMGGACASGAPGWLALPAWFLFVAMVRPGGLVPSLAVAGLPALAVALPWWLAAGPAPGEAGGLEGLRAWIALNGTPPLNPMAFVTPPAWPMPEGRWLFFPWDAVMRPSEFEGPWMSPGPLVLALGLPALFVCGRDGRRAAAFAVMLGLTVMFLHPSTRLLVPAVAVLIGVAAIAVDRTPRLRRCCHAVFAVGIGIGLALHAITGMHHGRVVTGIETSAEWRERHVEMAPAFAWCNAHLDEGIVLSLDPQVFLLEPPAFLDYPALGAAASRTVSGQAQWLRHQGIRYIVYPEAVVQRNAAFRAAGITTMAARWRDYRNHFVQRAAFEDSDGAMIVVYEVTHVDAPR